MFWNIEKTNSQVPDKLKEDEVSSSEEACKTDYQADDDSNKEGTLDLQRTKLVSIIYLQ